MATIENRDEEHGLLKVLVHEYLSGGGTLGGVGAAEAAALLAQGCAMRDAMAADLRALPNVEAAACEPGDDFRYLVAAVDAVWSIAPEIGGVLAALCAAVPRAKWLGCDGASIAIAGSKRATRECLAAAGVAVPDAATPRSGRCIVKPDDGAGAADTRVFAGFAEARAMVHNDSTIEAFIDGEPLSLSLLCARGAVELLSINRQHIEIDAHGLLAFRGVDIAVEPMDSARAASLRALAARVGDALPGLFGFVGIDLVWHAQRGPVVIEVNPRVTTAYVGLSARLGRNLARDLLAAWSDG